MSDRIVIEQRYSGPPSSANGGYACGMVASFIGPIAEVTLRSPPPLDTSLAVHRDDGRVLVHDGDTLVAEGRAAAPGLEVPEPVGLADAEAASQDFAGHVEHVFPRCLVCGTARSPAEGLRIFPGWLPDRERVAAVWEPSDWQCDEAGDVRPEIVWAALDCPSAWTYRGDAGAVIVLGRLTVELRAPVACSERIVVVAWPIGMRGRTFTAGAALFGPDGGVRGVSRAVWIKLQP